MQTFSVSQLYSKSVDFTWIGCKSLQGPGSMLLTNKQCTAPGASYADIGGHSTSIVKKRKDVGSKKHQN